MSFTEIETVGHFYLKLASSIPKLPAFITSTGTISHDQLMNIVVNLTTKLEKEGTNKNSIIAFDTDDIIVVIAILFATSIIGSTAVVATSKIVEDQTLIPSIFLKSNNIVSSINKNFKILDETWINHRNQTTLDFSTLDTNKTSPWLYLSSSGTTGREKFVRLSHVLMRSRVFSRLEDYPFRGTVLASSATANSRLLWARLLPVLLRGGAFATGYSPNFWIESGVTHVCGSPQQISYLFRGSELPRKIENLEVGGAPVNRRMVSYFLKYFDTVVDSYGAVETSKSYENVYTLKNNDVQVFGRKIDSEVQIVNTKGEQLPIGQAGQVRIRNDHMAEGYISHGSLTPVINEQDGWFYPGDEGVWSDNHTLKILGRTDQVINIGGAKLLTAEIEDYINQFAYINDAACVQFLDEKNDPVIRILLEITKLEDKNSIISNMCRYAGKEKGVYLTHENFVVVSKIPRNSNGKIDRADCITLASASKH